MSEIDDDRQARALWRRAERGEARPGQLHDSELASYFEGRMDAVQRAQVEERLAEDPDAVETLLFLHDLEDDFYPGTSRSSASATVTPLRSARWLPSLALAASLLLVACLGFLAGGQLRQDLDRNEELLSQGLLAALGAAEVRRG